MGLVRIVTDDKVKFSDAFVDKNQVAGLQVIRVSGEVCLQIFLISGKSVGVEYSSIEAAEKAMERLALML